jgi:hypothetical protein
VVVPPAGPDGSGSLVEYVLVLEGARRRVIGTQLVRAIEARWPGARLSPPASEDGVALCRTYQPAPTADAVFAPEFIEQALRDGASWADLERSAAAHAPGWLRRARAGRGEGRAGW